MKTKTKFTKKKLIALLTLALIVVLTVVALIVFLTDEYKVDSDYKYDGSSLVGKWKVTDNFSHDGYYVYEFFSIGGAEFGKVNTTYYVRGIPFIFEDSSTYRIEGTNTLVLTYSSNGVLQSSSSKFSINEERNEIVINGDEKLKLAKYDLEYNKDSAIFGEWIDKSNPTDVYTFLTDYTGYASDGTNKNKIVFSTLEDKMYLFIDENLPVEDGDYGNIETVSKYVFEIPYSINASTLTLTIEGEVHTFERSK